MRRRDVLAGAAASVLGASSSSGQLLTDTFRLTDRQFSTTSSTLFTATDGAGNPLSVQADAINHWPDGSVRWMEIRGYTSRSIAGNGSDTIKYGIGGSTITTRVLNNTTGAAIPAGAAIRHGIGFRQGDIPGGTMFNNVPCKMPAQLLTDLTAFAGAQDLNIELSAMASCSGASNVYTTGTWTAHFNTLAGGPYVQQVNMGSCCMGFRAWGQLTNTVTGAKHAHIHIAFYVWLWLNPTTGAIRDVEYIVYLHNSLLTQSTDGTLYSTFKPDRYNYNPALKNGGIVIVNNSDPTMVLHAGSPGVVGGHHPRSGWFTARADGKTRWINGTVEAPNLHISLDPMQANPQTVVTARDYLTSTGLLPRYDAAATDIPIPIPVGTVSYAPMVKGVIEQFFDDWNTGVAFNAGGNGVRIALLTGDQIFNFYTQTPGTAQNNRITSLGFMTFPAMYLDTNGRVPNILNADLPGLTPHTNHSIWDCTPNTEQGTDPTGNVATAQGNWVLNADTTHWPNLSYYTYLMEGGAHHRDCVITQSFNASKWWYQDCEYNASVRGFGTNLGQNRAPTYAGTKWYGNSCCNWSSEREEAWNFREAIFPPAVLPDALADGTVFSETTQFKTCVANTCGYVAAVINGAMQAGQIALGAQFYYGGFLGSLTVPLPPGDSAEEPWFQSGYIAQVWARAYLLHHNEPTISANITTMVNFQRTFGEQFLANKSALLVGSQDLGLRYGIGTSATWRSWANVGVWMNSTNFGGNYVVANFLDTVTGWVTFTVDTNPGADSGGWFPIPVDPGMKICFSRDFFAISGNSPPSPFTVETVNYRIVTVDLPNKRVKLCLDTDGTNTVLIPGSIVRTVPTMVIALAPASGAPVTYTDNSAVPPVARSFNGDGGPGAQISGQLLAIRAYRACFDTAASATADAAIAAQIVAGAGGSGVVPPRSFFATSPMSWIKYP